MNGFLQHLAITLRLYTRNKMALFYSYLFPLIFLVAFAVLYRGDNRPLASHMGELLTVAVLGGACFGLPTGMVNERERGVWRRYRLAPIPTRSLIASTAVARYASLLTAGLLQVGLAIAVAALMVSQRASLRGQTFAYYLPLPAHPFQLVVAFTFVAFAFIGLGLIIAMLADNVPAVQALGQCIFLPMLIIGGVAVKLEQLGSFQHVSVFFPGRYAVEAIQSCVTGGGLGQVQFSLLALFLIGISGCVAGSKMFRWDAQQRFIERGGKGWIAAALATWVLVGVLAEFRGRIGALAFGEQEQVQKEAAPKKPTPKRPGANFELNESEPKDSPTPSTGTSSPPGGPQGPATQAAIPVSSGARMAATKAAGPASWRDVTMSDIEGLAWDAPPDQGVVSPMAKLTDDPGTDVIGFLAEIRASIPDWAPAKVEEPVQRVRNILYIAAAPDVLQTEIESYLPHVVLGYLREQFEDKELSKLLCWIALHPLDGEVSAAGKLEDIGIQFQLTQAQLLRQRTYYYAQKFLARTAGLVKQE